MAMNFSHVLAGLTAILGEDGVVGDAAGMQTYLNEPRRRFHAAAAAVARPADVAQVQALCRWANEQHVPLVPQGGNTGLVGAQVPMRGDEVIVSLTRLDRVREVDAAAGHMTLEAGVILSRAHEIAEDAGAMFPLWIASEGSARIGGVLSSNAGGVQVLAFGNARELCLGVEAVLA
ncbi:MAG TPA: FAD-binding oxidoreductase, partial [Devosia sp.]|nr:FAD-binding oxidoreductase [Devosia sp.]